MARKIYVKGGVLTVLLSCIESEPTDSAHTYEKKETQESVCGDGVSGEQSCLEESSGWALCNCADSDPDTDNVGRADVDEQRNIIVEDADREMK